MIQTKSPLEIIRAMCQVAEQDCIEAEARTVDGRAKRYYQGKAEAYNSVLALIKTLEKK